MWEVGWDAFDIVDIVDIVDGVRVRVDGSDGVWENRELVGGFNLPRRRAFCVNGYA
jgi:hypothetical protein